MFSGLTWHLNKLSKKNTPKKILNPKLLKLIKRKKSPKLSRIVKFKKNTKLLAIRRVKKKPKWLKTRKLKKKIKVVRIVKKKRRDQRGLWVVRLKKKTSKKIVIKRRRRLIGLKTNSKFLKFTDVKTFSDLKYLSVREKIFNLDLLLKLKQKLFLRDYFTKQIPSNSCKFYNSRTFSTKNFITVTYLQFLLIKQLYFFILKRQSKLTKPVNLKNNMFLKIKQFLSNL